MGTLLLALCLLGDDDKFRVEGPPFIVFGGEGGFELSTQEKDVAVVWRIADAPGSVRTAVESVPKYSDKDFTIRGVRKIKVKSVGATEGDMRIAVVLERDGRRVASGTFAVRIGPAIRIPVQFRIVEHAGGGTADAGRYTDEKRRKELQDKVNAIWRQCGVEFSFALGKPVRGRDAWFDEEGRFHPVIRKDGEREKSAALVELFKNDQKDVCDVFAVGNCHWTEKAKGLGDVTVDHDLSGVGVQEESVLIDDAADPTTIAHELGHFLGLNDLGVEARSLASVPPEHRRRLMCSVRKFRSGLLFSYEEMKTARETARKVIGTNAKIRR